MRTTLSIDDDAFESARTYAQARDLKLPQPSSVVLFSAALTALAADDPRRIALDRTDCMIALAGMPTIARLFYGGDVDPSDPRVNLLAGSLRGLPPLAAFSGTREIMHFDALRLEERAREEDVTVAMFTFVDMFHAWPIFPIPEARHAVPLLHRFRTGRGQALDIALLDCYYHYHEASVYQVSASEGRLDPTRGGRHYTYVCPNGVFRVKERAVVIVAFLHHWPDLCAAMARADMVSDPRYATDAARVARRSEVIEIIETWLDTFADADAALAHLEAHGVPCAPVLSVKETLSHPHFLERGTVRTVTDPVAGSFQIPGMPIRTCDYPADLPYVAPLLGEHNAAILSELLGMNAAEIAALGANGVLVEGPN